MKNRNFLLATCLIWAMSISAQMSDAARRVHEKLQAFVASGEYRGTLEDNYHGISSLTRGSKKED